MQNALLVYRSADQSLQDVARAGRLQSMGTISAAANEARYEMARLLSLRRDAQNARDQKAFRLRLENLREATADETLQMKMDGLLLLDSPAGKD